MITPNNPPYLKVPQPSPILTNQNIPPLQTPIKLHLLQQMRQKMKPATKQYNIIQLAQLIQNYLLKYQFQILLRQQIPKQMIQFDDQLIWNDVIKYLDQQEREQLEEKMEERIYGIMSKFKEIFLYYNTCSINYQTLNQYFFNKQLTVLHEDKKSNQEYLENGQKRIRINENIKLCIMPLKGIQQDSNLQKNTKIIELAFREYSKGKQLEEIYVFTRDYLRNISIVPELIGIASDFERKGDKKGCWYHYKDYVLKPERQTISVLFKEKQTAITSHELKQQHAAEATNLEEKIPPHHLKILKITLHHNTVGILSMDLSFTIEPLNPHQRLLQGYIGNLNKDLPDNMKYTTQDKFEEILLFKSFGEYEWVIMTKRFIFIYKLPTPAQKIIINDQNNIHKIYLQTPNPLLLLCQKLPKNCIRAILLNKPYIAIMLDTNIIIIIKIEIKNDEILAIENKVYINFYTITNKIYNDVMFKDICYHQRCNYLFLSDFGAYVMRAKFNQYYGDIEDEGLQFDSRNNTDLIKQYSTRIKSPIRHRKQRKQSMLTLPHSKPKKSYLSIFKKECRSQSTKIIHNHTRQVIRKLSTNKHYSTLITYQSQSYQKNNKVQVEGNLYRQWGNKNTIKLWDIHHMTVYQIFVCPVQVGFLELRANGLYVVTRDRGYLGYFGFIEEEGGFVLGEKEQKAIDKERGEVLEVLSDEIMLDDNKMYFWVLHSAYNRHSKQKISQTKIYSMTLQSTPIIQSLYSLPTQVTTISLSNHMYVLQNSSIGQLSSNIHVYNKMGLKQHVISYKYTQEINQVGKIKGDQYCKQYRNMRKIQHQQFQVVVWNSQSIKLIGGNVQNSLTLLMGKRQNSMQLYGKEVKRSISSIEINHKNIVIHAENTTLFKKSTSKQPQKDFTLYILSLDRDRITYKLDKIANNLRVLHLYNSLLITQQQYDEDAGYDLIRVMDVEFPGEQIQKLLFAVRYRRTFSELINASQAEEGVYAIDPQYNQLIQGVKVFERRKNIYLQQSKITISESNKLIFLLIFKVETVYLDPNSKLPFRSIVEFLLYARNISDELFNKDYRINKFRVQKVLNKHAYEYLTESGKREHIVGHQTYTLDEISKISKYIDIDMQKLCDYVNSEEGQKYQGLDLTSKIINPGSYRVNHKKDIYQLLSLRKDKNFFKMFQQSKHKSAVISSFSFKMLNFNEDSLNGTLCITNKHLRAINLYNFQMNVEKDSKRKFSLNADMSEPLILKMSLIKISCLRVKSQLEMEQTSNIIKSKEQVLSQMEKSQVDVIQWHPFYKSKVQKFWNQTYEEIRGFIRQKKEKKVDSTNEQQEDQKNSQRQKIQQRVKRRQSLKFKTQSNQKQDRHRYVSQSEKKKKIITNNFGDNPEDISSMFRKWSISQGIQIQKRQKDLQRTVQTKNVHKGIKKVVKDQQITNQRMQHLIKNVDFIKQKSKKPVFVRRNKYENHLENVYETVEIAKKSSLQAYLTQKELSKDPSTKKSFPKQKNTQILQDSRLFKTPDKIKYNTIDTSENIQHKLDDIILKSNRKVQQQKQQALLVDLINQGRKLSLNKKKTHQSFISGQSSSYENTRLISHPRSQSVVQKLYQIKETKPDSKKKEKQKPTIKISTKAAFSKSKTDVAQSPVSFSIFSPVNFDSNQQNFIKRENENPEKALEQLKRSQIAMKDVVLPNLKSNQQKLVKKMKQKRSFIKLVNEQMTEAKPKEKNPNRDKIKTILLQCQ